MAQGSPVRRALVITDVVESTRLTAELGEERAATLWAQHNEITRELIEQFGGREIDRSDGFLLLFDEVTHAVAFVLAYHEALAPLGLAARAGVHLGDVILRTNPEAHVARGAKPLEVEGVAKSLAARVSAIALGGQTLITDDARSVLRTIPGAEIEERGHWRLHGIDAPVAIYEVGVRGLAPFVPPPDAAKAFRVVRLGDLWVPAQEIPRSLPAERDAFVGREEDLADVARALETSRLVSVLGVGGTGKTRLAIRYAWTWLGEWPGGAWFCDLTEARSLEGILFEVAQALDVPLTSGDPVVQLGQVIASRGRCLLVLDNFEQVGHLASATIGAWLDKAPDAHVVVTTREVLALPGECVLALAPLPIPDDTAAGEEALASPSIQLLITRARAANRMWRLDDTEIPGVVALVRMLEGIPLAIELAAARLRVLTISQMVARLGDRFALLVGKGARTDRHATLEATFDWSWDLLDERERDALIQLTSFSGGFTLTSAEAVLDVGAPAIDIVTRLVDKSMLREVHGARFGMWVTVHEYVGRKGPEPSAAHVRHGQHFAKLGSEEAMAAFKSEGGLGIRKAMGAELDNLLRACARAAAREDADVAVGTWRAAFEILVLRGPFARAASLTRSVLGLACLDARQRARLEERFGYILWTMGDPEGRDHLDRALVAAREAGDRPLEGQALRGLGLLHVEQGRTSEARACFDRALAIFVEGGDATRQAYTIWHIAYVQREQGELDEALASAERALALARKQGATILQRSLFNTLGLIHSAQGRHGEARRMFDQALRFFQEIDDGAGEAAVLGNLGELCLAEGRMDEARHFLEKALTAARSLGQPAFEADLLGELGRLYLEEGRVEEARAGLEKSLAIAREVGERRTEGHVLGALGEVARRRGQPDVAVTLVDEGERILREIRDVVDLAKLLCTKARVAQDRGDADLAWGALREAAALADSFGATPPSDVRLRIARAEAAFGPRLVAVQE